MSGDVRECLGTSWDVWGRLETSEDVWECQGMSGNVCGCLCMSLYE